jgi:hypothetical protein
MTSPSQMFQWNSAEDLERIEEAIKAVIDAE